MKLYVNQKVFSLRDKFYVKDEYGEDKYYVEGELFSFGKKLHIFDMSGCEKAMVHEKVLSFTPRFYVYVNGQKEAEIIKKITFFTNKYYVEGYNWNVDGDVFAHDYEIKEHEKVIMNIHKRWMSWGDSYEIDIDNNCDDISALAVVLAIDCAILRNSQ